MNQILLTQTMKPSRIFALIGSIIFTLFTLIALAGFWIILLMKDSSALTQELQSAGVDPSLLSLAITIAGGFLFILLILNWLAFAKMDKKRGWTIYLLGIGIFYGVASVFNGAGLIVTLPLALCFILSYVFKRREINNK